MSDQNLEEVLGDDQVLNYTQNLRKDLVDDITKGGMPGSKEDRQLLLQALGDMDRTALTKKRIGSQEKMSNADRMANMAIAKISKTFGSNNPFQREEIEVSGETLPNALQAEETLPEITLSPGETDVGISDLTYDSFMEKFEDD